MFIEDNFFGRAPSGSCAQLLCYDTTATTVFSNNVCYGGQTAGATLEGGKIICTGNVLIAPQLYWRGQEIAQQPANNAGGAPTGLRLFLPQPNVVVSGNYIEGACSGLTIWDSAISTVGIILPGVVITHSTIAGNSGTDTTVAEFDALPAVMNANQWVWVAISTGPGSAVFDLPNVGPFDCYSDYADPTKDPYSYDQQSAGANDQPLIYSLGYDPRTYDDRLATDTVAQAMQMFRNYVAGCLSGYADPRFGAAASGTDGTDGSATATLGAAGEEPPTPTVATYTVQGATPLSVSAGGGLLSGLTGQFLAALAVAPLFGTVNVNADGSFVYTPNLAFVGQQSSDTFQYLISDGIGGTLVETVTLTLT